MAARLCFAPIPPVKTMTLRAKRETLSAKSNAWSLRSVRTIGERLSSSACKNIVEDHRVAHLVRRKRRVNLLNRRTFLLKPRRKYEGRSPRHNSMTEGALCSLGPRIDAKTYRAALHEDDWVMTVLAGNGGGETQDKLCLGAASASKLMAER